MYGKSKASLWRNLYTGTRPNFFSTILCFVAVVYKSFFFFITAVLRKLLDIGFSYKHCSFSPYSHGRDGVENREKVYCLFKLEDDLFSIDSKS